MGKMGLWKKTLLIEASRMTFRCESMPSSIKESTDKIGMMILKGVPAPVLDKENGNGRRYWPPRAAKDGAKTNVRKDVIPDSLISRVADWQKAPPWGGKD